MTAILEQPELLEVNDITTNEDLKYVKQIANFFPKAFNEVERLNLGEKASNSINKIVSQGNGLVSLINNVPNMRFITVDYWNNVYEAKDFKITPTQDFYIGVKRHARATGYVFEDKNGDGKKTAGEPGVADVIVSLYDESGNLIHSMVTTKTGQYTFEKTYYDETMYLVVETARSISPLYTEAVPESLINQKVVSRIMLPFTETQYQVSQNIGFFP